MPKRKHFKLQALSCTSTRTHLEGRRSVELIKLSFKTVRASRAEGFHGPYGGSQLVLRLYRIYFFCFQMCNRLPEIMKNGMRGYFLFTTALIFCIFRTSVTLPLCHNCELVSTVADSVLYSMEEQLKYCGSECTSRVQSPWRQ